MKIEELDATMALAPKEGSTERFIAFFTKGRAHPTECQCDQCKSACRRIPCLATPQDIQTLINRGHFEKLMLTDWSGGVEFGIPPIPMIQIAADYAARAKEQTNFLDFLAASSGLLGGACPFWDKGTGLCTIHAYKPTEGKMGNCHDDAPDNAMESTTVAVAFSWLLPANRELVRSLFERFGEKPFPYWPKEEATHIPANIELTGELRLAIVE